ncbi:MAG: putative toxin-antitoxin system toxin component, PIN family, partial [Pseudomonadota bacterium]
MSVFRRLVFDTSTLVSASLRVGSIPHRALAHALATGEVCASVSTLAELEEVLLRPKFDRYQPANIRKEFIAILRRRASLFVVSDADASHVIPPCRDPKDNQFLALAKVCGAGALVSSDADLLVMHPWQGIPILTPAEFI